MLQLAGNYAKFRVEMIKPLFSWKGIAILCPLFFVSILARSYALPRVKTLKGYANFEI